MLLPKPWPEERDDADVPPWLLAAVGKRLRRKYERLKRVWKLERRRKAKPPALSGSVRERAPPYRASCPVLTGPRLPLGP